MAPAFWINCNRCFARFTKETTIYLLSCKHLACKSCMSSHSDKGKKCPVCSADKIAFSDLTKLSDAQKNYFMPKPSNLLDRPIQCIQFQDKQMQKSADYIRSMKQKFKKSSQKVAEVKQEFERTKKLLNSTIAKRRMMQEKLRKLWAGKMNRDPAQYRDPVNSFSSGSASRPGTSKASTTANTLFIQSDGTSSKTSESGFFDNDAPMFQNPSTQKKVSQLNRKQPFIV